MKIIILNGPNLNFTGKREEGIYGTQSYEDMVSEIKEFGAKKDIQIDVYQSNMEGELINKIQESNSNYDGLIINPGAFSHYSIAILDALSSIKIPKIEVHLSNIHNREKFREKSITAAASIGVIAGFGIKSYKLAIEYFLL
jgi:3-dehydroquinate dehydratase-2